jgi:hypothetical protein
VRPAALWKDYARFHYSTSLSSESAMRNFSRRTVAAFLFAFCLAACGGSGSDSGNTSAPAQFGSGTSSTAEGIYIGTTSSGFVLNALVLETGEFFWLYGTSATLKGLLQGTGISGPTRFSSNNGLDFNVALEQRIPAAISAEYVQRQAMNGSITEAGQTSTFAMSYQPSYDLPANLAALEGSYAGTSVTPAGLAALNFFIGANGTIGGTSTVGTDTPCTFQGTAAPRPTGKNVLNLVLQFNVGGCSFGTSTFNAVGVPITSSGTGQTMYLVGVSPDRASAFIGVGAKLVTTTGGSNGNTTGNGNGTQATSVPLPTTSSSATPTNATVFMGVSTR